MNQYQQLVTFGAASTGAYAIGYLLSDEYYDAIEFGDLTTTGTISSDYLVIESSPISEYDVNFYGPTTITFNPSSLNLPNKIVRIDYYFGDVHNEYIKPISHGFYYSLTSVDTQGYPFPSEPGDPRNFPVTHTFTSNQFSIQSFDVYIFIYQVNVADPVAVYYKINILAPNVDDYSSDINPYFGEMHLISTRMFGTNNDILYTFESQNPNYVIPVLINWNQLPTLQIENTNQTTRVPRNYRILSPIEIKNYNNDINNNIKIITQVNSPINNNITQSTKKFSAINAA